MKNRKDKQQKDRERMRERRALASKHLIKREVFLTKSEAHTFDQLIAPLGGHVRSMAASLKAHGLHPGKRPVAPATPVDDQPAAKRRASKRSDTSPAASRRPVAAGAQLTMEVLLS